MSQGLLTADQAAALLGVKSKTVRIWANSKPAVLPVVRLSARCVRFRPEDVDALITSRLEGPADGAE